MMQVEFTAIKNLIALKQEGGFWDFKREWYSNNNDLLHDIICMANNLESHDGYIIIGVDEENSYSWLDISNDQNRRTTQNLVDFLREKKFAGGFRPTVKVETFSSDAGVIDVIVIENNNLTPFYLSDPFQGVFANNIYTRIQDTNTPINKSADLYHIEYLWKKRFGIDKSAMERLQVVLADFDNWEYKSDLPHYHKSFPEFHIEYEDVENDDISCERYCRFYLNEKGSQHRFRIYYHSTILHDGIFLYLDEARVTIPDPTSCTFIIGNREMRYYPFLKNTIAGMMLGLFTKGTFDTSSRETGGGAFLVFESRDEKLCFEDYVATHISTYDAIDLNGFASKAIEYEKTQWNIKFCETMARLYFMYRSWKNEVTTT